MKAIKRVTYSALGGAAFGMFTIWIASKVLDTEVMGFAAIVGLIAAAVVATGISETIIANEEENYESDQL